MKPVYALIVLLAVIIAGCTGGGTTTGFSPYLGGTQGLQLQFLQGSPPSEIYDNRQFSFSVGVQVVNRGEFDLERGYIEIDGILPQEYGVSDADLRQNLPIMAGATKTSSGLVLPGDLQVVSFDGLNYQQDLSGSLGAQTLRAVACYNYETRVSIPNVCVKQDAFQTGTAGGICAVQGQKQFANSGGPVQITRVTQNMAGGERIQLEFQISHVGTGDRFFRPSKNECNYRQNDPDLYRVDVSVGSLINNEVPAICTGFSDSTPGSSRGEVFLSAGQPRQIYCTFDISSVSRSAEVPLLVTIAYKYMDSIETQFTVRDIN